MIGVMVSGILFLGTFAAQAENQKLEVCGYHHVVETYKHVFDVEVGDVPLGRHDLYATNQIAARVVNRLEDGAGYCLEVWFSPERPREGLAFITIRSSYGDARR